MGVPERPSAEKGGCVDPSIPLRPTARLEVAAIQVLEVLGFPGLEIFSICDIGFLPGLCRETGVLGGPGEVLGGPRKS